MAPRGRRRSQQASMESSGAPSYEENLVERLARSLERSGFTASTVDQARRLGVVGLMAPQIPWWPYLGLMTQRKFWTRVCSVQMRTESG